MSNNDILIRKSRIIGLSIYDVQQEPARIELLYFDWIYRSGKQKCIKRRLSRLDHDGIHLVFAFGVSTSRGASVDGPGNAVRRLFYGSIRSRRKIQNTRGIPLAIAKGRCDLEITLSWHLIKSYDIDVPGWERTRVYFTWIVTTACFYLIRGATLRMRVRERKRNREKRATTTVLKQTEAKITIQKYD